MSKDELNTMSKIILEASLDVHREMWPGLLESIYELCLSDELNSRGLRIDNQASIPLLFKGRELSKDFRVDILVEDAIILEIKSVECILPVHEAQIVSYLKLTDKRLGFLINFNVVLLKYGFKRYVH